MRLLAVLALGQVVLAKPSFQNSGTIKGWNKIIQAPSAKIEEVTGSNALIGPTSLKITQFDDQLFDYMYGPDYAAELQVNDGYSPVAKRYYAMKWMIPAEFNLESDTKYEIMRFVADYHGDGCLGIYNVLTVWLRHGKLGLTSRTDNPCPAKTVDSQPVDIITELIVTSGKVMKLIFGAAWDLNDISPNGFFELRLDDKKFRKDKIVTTPNNYTLVNFRVGFTPVQYSGDTPNTQNPVKFEKNMKDRHILIDEVMVTDTLDDARKKSPKA